MLPMYPLQLVDLPEAGEVFEEIRNPILKINQEVAALNAERQVLLDALTTLNTKAIASDLGTDLDELAGRIRRWYVMALAHLAKRADMRKQVTGAEAAIRVRVHKEAARIEDRVKAVLEREGIGADALDNALGSNTKHAELMSRLDVLRRVSLAMAIPCQYPEEECRSALWMLNFRRGGALVDFLLPATSEGGAPRARIVGPL